MSRYPVLAEHVSCPLCDGPACGSCGACVMDCAGFGHARDCGGNEA